MCIGYVGRRPRLADTPSRGTQPGTFPLCGHRSLGNIDKYMIVSEAKTHRHIHINERHNQRTQTTPWTLARTWPADLHSSVPRARREKTPGKRRPPPRAGICMYVMYACMYVCMHACEHVCMYACMHACMHVCIHACVHACMRACMHACVRACMRACVHTCMMRACICARMHTAVCCDVSWM